MKRRAFLTLVGVAGAGAVYSRNHGLSAIQGTEAAPAPYALPPLPYPDSALAPVISPTTVGLHYGKHHAGYVSKYNAGIAGKHLADLSLDQALQELAQDSSQTELFNAGAQIWNHNFYRKSLRPQGGGKPGGKLKELFDTSFGGYEKFREELITKSTSLFGSGWAWLIHDKGQLKIVQTSNADTPIVHKQTPLLTIDVWEHAYYVDYQNRRKDYVEAVIDKLLNWEFAEANLA